MKYCGFCGNELKDNEICTCDKAVAEMKNSRKPVFVNAPSPEKKKKPYKLITCIVILLLAATVVVLLSGKEKKVDSFEYVSVSFEGLDGQGRAIVSVDTYEMALDVYKSNNDNDCNYEDEEWKDFFDSIDEIEDFEENIEYSVDRKTELKNHDIITVTITCSDDASKHYTSGTQTYTVSGLTEVKEIDGFKDVEITFDGISGEARIKIINNSTNEFLQNVSYVADKIYEIENGQTITITADYLEETAIQYGYVLKENTKKSRLKVYHHIYQVLIKYLLRN